VRQCAKEEYEKKHEGEYEEKIGGTRARKK
jgi:hypothetical protein